VLEILPYLVVGKQVIMEFLSSFPPIVKIYPIEKILKNIHRK